MLFLYCVAGCSWMQLYWDHWTGRSFHWRRITVRHWPRLHTNMVCSYTERYTLTTHTLGFCSTDLSGVTLCWARSTNREPLKITGAVFYRANALPARPTVSWHWMEPKALIPARVLSVLDVPNNTRDTASFTLALWRHYADRNETKNYYYYYVHLTAFFPGQPGWAGNRKVNQSGFYWSKRWRGGSGISWTVCKSFTPHQFLTTQFLQARFPTWHPTNSVKAL